MVPSTTNTKAIEPEVLQCLLCSDPAPNAVIQPVWNTLMAKPCLSVSVPLDGNKFYHDHAGQKIATGRVQVLDVLADAPGEREWLPRQPKRNGILASRAWPKVQNS